MKVVIFGIGRFYQRYKDRFLEDMEIVAFLDNAGIETELDGIPVYKPESIVGLDYEFIFLLSVHENEMRKQLIDLGVPILKIYGMDRIEKICDMGEPVYYGCGLPSCGKKNILMFSHAMTSTGAQNILFITACELKRLGYAVVVVSKSDGVVRERLVGEGIPVIITKSIILENNTMQRLVCWADKILINTLWLYYLAVEFGRSGKDIVWWLHESEGLWRHDKDILRYILEQPNIRVYAVSNVVKKVVEDGIGIRNKVEVLSFGLPEYPIDDRREDGKKVFAIIGGICHNKGQDIFIDAIEKLPQQCRQSSEFWIVGKGILQQEELEKANRYPCIKICGEIDNREIKDIYSQIDVVVCCSREEGMSITVIEGFMNRKITIVTEIAGVAKFVKDGVNGFIMKNEDSDHLAEIMQSIIKSPERFECIGNEARKTFDRFFSMEVFRPKLIKVFE